MSRRSRAMMAPKCTKKHDARAKLLFCYSKPISFLPFSLPSPSSLLKLLICCDPISSITLANKNQINQLRHT